MKLRDLASRLQCTWDGDGEIDIRRVAGLEQAGDGDLTFFTNPRYADALKSTRASAVILGPDGPALSCPTLRTPHPYLAVARALALLHPQVRPAPGVHPLAHVADDAVVASSAAIGAFAVVEAGARVGDRTVVAPHVVIGAGSVVGDDCWLHAHVSVREKVTVGARVILQNGAVIGSDGFGFARRSDGTHEKIPQVGTVVIEDDVEIGANSTVDRPAVGETRIRAGTKIDNLVQVAHGVSVGRDVLLAAQVGIAGSSRVEDRVTLAGQVGVAGHITIGHGVVATAQTGIPNSVDAGAFISGYPAIPNRDWLKSSAVFRKLPELRRTIAALEARLAALEGALAARSDPESP
ncbi:MAG: UDP-3-O-(3-hydroxymyristoyl)glucosamine N-acyltransferase [Vicinamibacterales bacterium]